MSEAIQIPNADTDSEDRNNLAEKFRALTLRYIDIGAREGVKINGFVSNEMPLLRKASLQKLREATDFLSIIVSIHEETLAQGDAALSHKLTWRALSRFSLVPEAKVFSRLTDDDIVLIYDNTQTVIFWNLQFFKFFSLTVEQIFFGVWYELTERDPAMAQKVYEMAVNIISGKVTGTFETGVPPHEVREVGTEEIVRLWMELPWGSVLSKKDGSFGGIFLTHKLRVL